MAYFNEAGYETNSEIFDQAADEVVAEDEAIARIESEWRDSLLSKKEREDVFINSGAITHNDAEEKRRKFLREEYEQEIRANARGEKNEKKISKIASEYNARMDNKGITDDDIQRASQTPISELHNTQGRKVVQCIFHQDSSPSMSVTGNLWHCFAGCGGGDSIEFIKKREGLDFKSAVKYILHL